MNTYWKKNFSWSKSRQGLLDECPLAYYYTYIARHEQDSQAKVINSLLKLKKLHFFKGEVIHASIRSQITQHCVGRPVSLEAAQNLVSMEFNKVFKAQDTYLSEAYNGFPLEGAILKKEQEDALAQIERFFSVIWHNYKQLEFLTHERLEHFFLGDIKVWVQPDLVTKNNSGILMISDWKTGSQESARADTDLQLSVYILWASLHFGVPAQDIGAELVFLKTAQAFATKRSLPQINELKDYILKEARAMLSVNEASSFVPRPRFNLCKGCNFSTICPASAAKKKQDLPKADIVHD
jgi:hypothetical protein